MSVTKPLEDPSGWLLVSIEGFAQENRGRPRTHIVKELVQNAMDAIGNNKGTIDLDIRYEKGKRGVSSLVIECRDTGGGITDWDNLRTMFYTSKQDSVLNRGRFGRGFKEMLCLANECTVASGKHTRLFYIENNKRKIDDSDSPHVDGTVIEMCMPWPESAIDELVAYFQTFVIPKNLTFKINGEPVKHRTPKHIVEVSLPTEMYNNDSWTRPVRKTAFELIQARKDETAMIYEMGIPICALEWDFPYHANVLQRVPMNPKRDAVQTGYAKKIHTAAIPLILDELTKEQVMSDTVSAVATNLDDDVQRKIISTGLGDDIVRAVPTIGRRDFNNDATELGKKTIETSQLHGGLREIVRKHIPTAKEAVDFNNHRLATMAAQNNFTVAEVYAQEVKDAQKKQKLVEAVGGRKRVEDVLSFALWFCQRLLDTYEGVVLNGVKLAIFPDRTIATWDTADNLSLGLNYEGTFTAPLSPETLTIYVHEVGHHLNAHHAYNFHAEVEKLSGVAAHIMLVNADIVKQRWPSLFKTIV